MFPKLSTNAECKRLLMLRIRFRATFGFNYLRQISFSEKVYLSDEPFVHLKKLRF